MISDNQCTRFTTVRAICESQRIEMEGKIAEMEEQLAEIRNMIAKNPKAKTTVADLTMVLHETLGLLDGAVVKIKGLEKNINVLSKVKGNAKEECCAFDALFTRCVPHILENIFFSLDYMSFKRCKEVNKAWKELLSSETYQKKSLELFPQEMLIEKKEDEMKLLNASREGNAEEVRRLLSKHVYEDFAAGGYAMFNSVIWGHNDVVKLLLDAGADVDVADKEGMRKE